MYIYKSMNIVNIMEKLKKYNITQNKLIFQSFWGKRETEGYHFDIDLLVFLVNKDNLLTKNNDLIFFNNLHSDCGSIKHKGDNRLGNQNHEATEIIEIDFQKIPDYVNKIIFYGVIYKAKERKQNFGQIKNAYIEFKDNENNNIFHYDLTEEAPNSISMQFLEIIKYNGEWFLNITESKTNKDLYDIVKLYIKK